MLFIPLSVGKVPSHRSQNCQDLGKKRYFENAALKCFGFYDLTLIGGVDVTRSAWGEQSPMRKGNYNTKQVMDRL